MSGQNSGVGPFISGVFHREYNLGQAVPLDHLKALYQTTKAQEAAEAAASARASKSQAGPSSGGGRGAAVSQVIGRATGGAGPTLKELIDVGLLRAGQLLTVTYKGATYKAPINKDGLIQYDGNNFSTASAFSVFVKRIQTPNKAGDDGWKSVHADGRPLADLRAKYSSMNSNERNAAAADQPKSEPGPPPDYAAIVAAKLAAQQQQAQAQQAAAAAAMAAAGKTHPANVGYTGYGGGPGGLGGGGMGGPASMMGPGGGFPGGPGGADRAHLLALQAQAAGRGGMLPAAAMGRGGMSAAQLAALQQQQLQGRQMAALQQQQHMQQGRHVQQQHGRHVQQQQQQEEEEEDDEPATDQWVQCSKCQTWRLVPDEFWPDIANADDDEDWTCKEALWDVEEFEPHTPACC